MNQEARKKSDDPKARVQQRGSERSAGKTPVKAAFPRPEQGARSRSSGSPLCPSLQGGVPAARALASPLTR